jgi:hypothetical protein
MNAMGSAAPNTFSFIACDVVLLGGQGVVGIIDPRKRRSRTSHP